MNQCDACRSLTLKPLRPDIPPHLQRYHARELSFGFVRVTTYECVRCESLWRWRIADGWEPANALQAVGKPAHVPTVLNERFA